MSEDLRHDGGDVEGGRVHVREVGVHVLGQYEQPNKAGPFWQPEQLGRPQHSSTQKTPSWKGRDLQKSSLSSKVFMVFWICQDWTNKLVQVCRTYHYTSKSVSKIGKIPSGKFDEFLTVCQYILSNVNTGLQWGTKFREITIFDSL